MIATKLWQNWAMALLPRSGLPGISSCKCSFGNLPLATSTHLPSSSAKSGRKYVTIKINVNTLSEDWLQGRRKVAERLSTTNPKHAGYDHVRFMLDTFRVKGPHGQHLCVVYDVLREPIGLTMEKLPGHLFGSDH